MAEKTVLTPDEAKQKWCPNYRSSDPHMDNRHGKCLADGCADWVWDRRGQQVPTHGYCGLTHQDD